MRGLRGIAGWAVGTWLVATLALAGWALMRGRTQDLPWTPLDLTQPPGRFTASKLAGLGNNFARCRAILDRAGVRYTALSPRRDGAQCGYEDGIRFAAGGARNIGFSPSDLGISCPVAVGLALWEWNIVQTAARRYFRSPVATVEHFGSYNCRRMYGRGTGGWSEHASADAVDIAGFRLADGTRITVARDWDNGDKGRFLHEVRDGACTVFSTTLSPDYNAAHADHLHLDQANRGPSGWKACR